MKENLLNFLKETKILNREDINNIKSYIEKKYSDASEKVKAEIFSNTIHNILDNQVKGFDENISKKIKKEVLKDYIFENKSSIFMYDIYESVVKNKEIQDNEKLENLYSWLNSKTNYKVDKDEIYNIVYRDKREYKKEDKKEKVKDYSNSFKKYKLIKGKYYKKKVIREDERKCCEKSFKLIIKDLKIKNVFKRALNNKKIGTFCILLVLIMFICIKFMPYNLFIKPKSKPTAIEQVTVKMDKDHIEKGSKIRDKKINSNMPEYMKYKEINEKKLELFLKNKNSILAEEEYLTYIICSAKEFDINPIVLVSIVGQEQNFVPRSSKEAKKIANNPFNVYHSWQEYNTDIYDSSQIAAKTVYNLCLDIPKNENPFKWINIKYAEDKNWWKGVEYYFKEISKFVEN